MPLPSIDPRTAERQTLDEIREWHRGMVDALVEQRAIVQKAIRNGESVPPRFVGMTDADLDRYYDVQRRDLDRLTIFNLVASAEATIRVDYFRRVAERLKDSLARAYQDWHKTLSGAKQLRPDFDEGGILDVLKDSKVMDNNIVGQFRECLRVRHWIGHGRYWTKPLEVDRFDTDDVYDRAAAILQELPG